MQPTSTSSQLCNICPYAELVINVTGAGLAMARPGLATAGSSGARRLSMISPTVRPVKRNPPGAVRFVKSPPPRFAGRGAAVPLFKVDGRRRQKRKGPALGTLAAQSPVVQNVSSCLHDRHVPSTR